MKLLLTGAHGFLGVRVFRHFSAHHSVEALSHQQFDITDAPSVREVLDRVRPDVVIHCAAVSDTGLAARCPDLSYSVNVCGTLNLARACADQGCKLVYMSSDQVYDGLSRQGLLPEDSVAWPANVYGRHKLEAEQAVRACCPDAVGLRLSWMYDLPASPLSPNRGLLLNLVRAAADGSVVRAALHEYRGVTYVWDVVERLEAALSLPGGVYNFGSENLLCSYDTFRLAAGRLCSSLRVEPDADRFASSPRNLSMDTARLRACGLSFPTVEEALARLLP